MLAGVLYFHDISAVRMGGTAVRNFHVFRRLCGVEALKRVVIVTNMWGEVDAGVGEAREAELMRDERFYKSVLDKGAQMARHNDTALSAEKIIGRRRFFAAYHHLVDRTLCGSLPAKRSR